MKSNEKLQKLPISKVVAQWHKDGYKEVTFSQLKKAEPIKTYIRYITNDAPRLGGLLTFYHENPNYIRLVNTVNKFKWSVQANGTRFFTNNPNL